MPHLQNLWSEVSKQRKDVTFLAVNIGDSKEQIAQWWQEGKFTLRAVRQTGDAVSRALGVQAYPTNYVVGPDGQVLYRGVGYDEEAIRKALGSTAK